MKYQLKRLQYSKIYHVNERTIRRWQDKEYPLDDPTKLLQVLTEQKNKPDSLRCLNAGDLLQHWYAESSPKSMRLDVQRELAFRISDAGISLQQARDLARERWKDWPEVAARLNAIREHVHDLLPLIGVNEDKFDWDECTRPQHLAGVGFIYSWGTDPERPKSESKRLVWADTASCENAEPTPANIISLPTAGESPTTVGRKATGH